MIEWIADWLTVILAAAGAPGIFVSMLLESACIPVPSEIVLPFAGILVNQQSMSFNEALFWGVGGQMTGSVLTYYVGMHGGRPFVERYGKYVLMRKHELDVAERWFQRYGEITVFAARLLPGVRTFISLPAGVARMPVPQFVLYSFLGVLPWTAFLIWLGAKVGKVWQDPRWHGLFRTMEVVVIVGLLGLVVWFLASRRRDKPST